MGTGISNVYDYSFEEFKDRFEFTVYTIGIGLDIENTKGIQYVINLLEFKLILDKNTGKISWGEDEEGTRKHVLKSMSLSYADLLKLAKMGYPV